MNFTYFLKNVNICTRKKFVRVKINKKDGEKMRNKVKRLKNDLKLINSMCCCMCMIRSTRS